MEKLTFKLVYKWTKYSLGQKFFHHYDGINKRAENIQTLTFSKSSAKDYKTILARLKFELDFNLNPHEILVFKNGKYEYLGKEGL